MNKYVRWLCGVLLVIATAMAVADTPERIIWNKRPINIQLQIGHERIIHFPDELRYWLPDSIKHKVSALAANGVLYIRALEHFSRTRIRIQGLNDQQVYLLDVVANDVEAVSNELIVMTKDSVKNHSKKINSEITTTDWRIRLTRYAAQQLYAPERLTGGDSAVKRIPLTLSTAIPLIRGGLVESVPIASWQAKGLTVTAVKLRNTSKQSLRLRFDNPHSPQALNMSHLIRGNWLAATLQHDSLGPIGDENDTTTLYLVSKQPFIESLALLPQKSLQNSGEDGDG